MARKTYEDYAMSSPMTDGKEITDFLDGLSEIKSPYHINPLDDDFEGDIDDYTFDIDPSELKI